jgi:hypothetical protein
MTVFNPIANSDIDPESPITTNLMSYLRDNPLAVAEGDPSAPDINKVMRRTATGTFNGVSSVDLDFSSDSDHVTIIFKADLSADALLRARIKEGGTAVASGVYDYQVTNNATFTQLISATVEGSTAGVNMALTIDLIGLNDGNHLAFAPVAAWENTSGTVTDGVYATRFKTVNTNRDGIQIFPSTGVMTGSYEVWEGK